MRRLVIGPSLLLSWTKTCAFQSSPGVPVKGYQPASVRCPSVDRFSDQLTASWNTFQKTKTSVCIPVDFLSCTSSHIIVPRTCAALHTLGKKTTLRKCSQGHGGTVATTTSGQAPPSSRWPSLNEATLVLAPVGSSNRPPLSLIPPPLGRSDPARVQKIISIQLPRKPRILRSVGWGGVGGGGGT